MIGIIRAAGGILCIAALPLVSVAHDGPAPTRAAATNDPVCGFAPGRNAVYFDEDPRREGLAVHLLAVPADAAPGRPLTLRFYVRRQPGDLAVDNLQSEHEKLFHVIGVRDDVNEFFHVHPARIAPGIWEVTRTFTNGGNYKIWSNLRFQDVSYAVGHPVLKLPGSSGEPVRHNDQADYEVRSGHQITFKHTEPLLAGNSASLQFLIRDATGREIETENFLGAPMHLVVLKDDLSVYRHAHPDHQDTPQSVISFTEVFPDAGRYKLFAQFRPKGTSLPPDDAILAEFFVTVAKGPYTPASAARKAP